MTPSLLSHRKKKMSKYLALVIIVAAAGRMYSLGFNYIDPIIIISGALLLLMRTKKS